jgi:outer membrane protein assembly factor BamB
LPRNPAFAWTRPLQAPGVGGLAATQDCVLVSDREAEDAVDVFLCLDAATGEERWSFRHPAVGSLDYGNSPRASPLILGDVVVVMGAFGGLHCLELATGRLLWQREVYADFSANDKLVWGMCSSPLAVDGKLIVNPGSKDAGLAALDLKTGDVVWKSPTKGRSHGSFIVAQFGGKRQIVGYDHDSLGGWDPASGERLWRLTPTFPNDFNVPTPIAVNGKLFVTTENNGSRLYQFDGAGRIDPQPIARHEDLAPDAHTPVVVGDRIFGVWRDLYCLDLHTFKTVWVGADPAFQDYCSIIASGDRLLITTVRGELILLDAASKNFQPTARLRLFPDDRGVYSHPAIVGSRFYIRSSDAVCCVDLSEKPGKNIP